MEVVAVEDLYTQEYFDRTNNIGSLSPESELDENYFELSKAFLYASPGRLHLDYFGVDKKDTGTCISFADSVLTSNNRELLHKSELVQTETNLNQMSTQKIKKQVAGKINKCKNSFKLVCQTLLTCKPCEKITKQIVEFNKYVGSEAHLNRFWSK